MVLQRASSSCQTSKETVFKIHMALTCLLPVFYVLCLYLMVPGQVYLHLLALSANHLGTLPELC